MQPDHGRETAPRIVVVVHSVVACGRLDRKSLWCCSLRVCVYIYIYVYMYVCVCIHSAQNYTHAQTSQAHAIIVQRIATHTHTHTHTYDDTHLDAKRPFDWGQRREGAGTAPVPDRKHLQRHLHGICVICTICIMCMDARMHDPFGFYMIYICVYTHTWKYLKVHVMCTRRQV
jgi:hypothetical protein